MRPGLGSHAQGRPAPLILPVAMAMSTIERWVVRDERWAVVADAVPVGVSHDGGVKRRILETRKPVNLDTTYLARAVIAERMRDAEHARLIAVAQNAQGPTQRRYRAVFPAPRRHRPQLSGS